MRARYVGLGWEVMSLGQEVDIVDMDRQEMPLGSRCGHKRGRGHSGTWQVGVGGHSRVMEVHLVA